MKTLFLIYGGKSQEHDISILTAFNILKAISYDTYTVKPIYIQKNGDWILGQTLTQPVENEAVLTWEKVGQSVLPTVVKEENAVVFPVLHGPNGEDGTVQGLFEILDTAYVGTGVLASACGMDKIISKKLFAQAGLPQLPYVTILKKQWLSSAETVVTLCEKELTYPMFVKPANLGSSVGISKATNKDELIKAIELALSFDRRVVVEKGVIARELEVAVLGHDDIKASVVGEVVKVVDFYDFEEKYKNNQATLQIPAQIPEDISETLRQYAIQAFEAIDGSGLTRCDFFLTEDNKIYINEVNTLPGFTQFSMYPLLWEATGIPYADLVNMLLDLAVKRYEEKRAYQMVE
ncbi:D-alanine--D-alanine ligase [Granulicatella sp. zg-ZJ]|uniref:D-alanine--D-alanine ligase n=1 Tax=Granulicatella sp. zg-ZJ TaxID=2678504 RepID=UPI0013D7E600|nr:D-alanine--D-alanine ligase [Granulicatella sp. zg-ZJ]NEW62572.1 D-alanine--D-alanine ligase [Granulicatella sp. zg-ZJ]